jgi:hypothetical protein
VVSLTHPGHPCGDPLTRVATSADLYCLSEGALIEGALIATPWFLSEGQVAMCLRLDLLFESRGLNDDHIAVGVLHDLAGHRSQHLALVRPETAVTHDDQAGWAPMRHS